MTKYVVASSPSSLCRRRCVNVVDRRGRSTALGLTVDRAGSVFGMCESRYSDAYDCWPAVGKSVIRPRTLTDDALFIVAHISYKSGEILYSMRNKKMEDNWRHCL